VTPWYAYPMLVYAEENIKYEGMKPLMYTTVIGISENSYMIPNLLIKYTFECRPVSIYSFSNYFWMLHIAAIIWRYE
jgi:hypothetical protein